ncbi:MAG: T9SS type A sorting domain-containing protein, partial [Pedobacter sp.]
GIVDAIEAGFADSNFNGFEDGVIGTDGWSNTIRARPAPLSLLNSDGIGRPNYLDIDSDGDGIPDNIEGQSTAGYRFPTYTDSDNDGLDNAYDLAPHTATFSGAGILLYDRDMDGTPDYIDLDSDSDGQSDVREGNDWNLNGAGDEILTPTGIDTDGDGLDDRFDLINSATNLKGTSIYMGTNGSMTGDPSPGTRATVQRTLASGGCAFERDWRCVSFVLPISHLQLTAAENNNAVTLKWSIISSRNLSVFEVERSTDNVNYQKIATQSATVRLDQMENFAGNDNIAGINSDLIYYRIKVIAQDGQTKYSNVVVIRKGKTIAAFSVMPNPANDHASVRFYTEKEMLVSISIRDFAGKLVYSQKVKALKGNNVLPLTNLSKYSDGVYHVQLM